MAAAGEGEAEDEADQRLGDQDRLKRRGAAGHPPPSTSLDVIALHDLLLAGAEGDGCQPAAHPAAAGLTPPGHQREAQSRYRLDRSSSVRKTHSSNQLGAAKRCCLSGAAWIRSKGKVNGGRSIPAFPFLASWHLCRNYSDCRSDVSCRQPTVGALLWTDDRRRQCRERRFNRSRWGGPEKWCRGVLAIGRISIGDAWRSGAAWSAISSLAVRPRRIHQHAGPIDHAE